MFEGRRDDGTSDGIHGGVAKGVGGDADSGKGFTRARDELAAMRRRMPWTLVPKEYRFEGPEGVVTLRTCSRADAS